MSRIATPADVAGLVALWNDALPAVEAAFGRSLSWTEASAKRLMGLMTFYIEPPDLGFFAVQASPIPRGPDAGQPATELHLWIVKRTLSDAEKRKVLRALFVAWFGDHKGELCWGTIPETLPALSLDFCEATGKGQWGWSRTDYERDARAWRLYVFRVPKAGVT
jgi:hypothetical protein